MATCVRQKPVSDHRVAVFKVGEADRANRIVVRDGGDRQLESMSGLAIGLELREPSARVCVGARD
jgi:hypothetical protein